MITGRTQLFCLLADPVDHVRTPQMFNDYVGGIGADAVLVPFHVPREGLAQAVAGLRQLRNLRGIIVTIPHKIDILELCDELHDSARLVGAANVVRRERDGRLTGANFDGIGFVGALEASVGKIAGLSIFVAGAGGVARAIAYECARAGAARLAIHNRSAPKAAELLASVARAFPHLSVEQSTARPDGCDIAINATSLGLRRDDPLPFPVDALPNHAIVADVVMQPPVTPLLDEARRRGLEIVTGEGMLEFQLPYWIDFIDPRLAKDAGAARKEAAA